MLNHRKQCTNCMKYGTKAYWQGGRLWSGDDSGCQEIVICRGAMVIKNRPW